MHHSPTADNISQQWVFIINASKNTILNMTQDWIRSVVMPLKKRYFTDLRSHNLRRLWIRFYTNTLFPKVKSIIVHDCGQIYTDGKGFI